MNELNKICQILFPYGRRKLILTLTLVCLRAVVGTIGIAVVYPFLSLATDAEGFGNSEVGAFVQDIFPSQSTNTTLLIMGASVVFATCLTAFVNVFVTWRLARYSTGLTLYWRTRLLWELSAREYQYFIERSVGILNKKINSDPNTVVVAVVIPLLNLVNGFVTITLIGTFLLWVEPIALLVSTVSLSLIYGAFFLGTKKFRGHYSRTMKHVARQTSRLTVQLIAGIKVVKIHGVERKFIDRIAARATDARAVQVRKSLVDVVPRNTIEPLGISMTLAMVGFANVSDLGNLLPKLGVFAYAAFRMLPLVQLTYSAVTSIGSHFYAVDEVLEEVGPVRSRHALSREDAVDLTFMNSVVFERVSFSYQDGAKPILSDLSFTLRKGQSLALLGATGSGKSTIVDLFVGLRQPCRGVIRVDSQVLDSVVRKQWLGLIGYVPQDVQLIDDTIAANIAMSFGGEEFNIERLEHVAKIAQIYEFITSLPDGWNTNIGERGAKVSGGQCQRIGIARALYRNPEVLILDEATSGLDEETEANVISALRQIRPRLTFLIITHRPSTITWCDDAVSLT